MTAGTNEQSRYTGRHARPRRKTTRKRVGRVVPAVAVAATVAAGTAAYAMAAGGSHPGQLSDALTSPASSARTAGAGAGWANSAAAAGLKTAAPAATASVSHTAAATPRATATKTAAPAPSPTATAAAAAASTPAASATSAPATSAPATALSCDLGYSMLPQNVTAIVSFLLAHGYSDNAAAGIAGNIYQESKGDPESVGSGGGGLIGFTPLPSGYVTGDAAADLQTQLAAILTYNEGWASYLPELNSAASPSDAAYIYVTDFERAGIPAAATRESSAADVASACGI